MKPSDIKVGNTYILRSNFGKYMMPKLVISYDPSGPLLGGTVRTVHQKPDGRRTSNETFSGEYFAERIVEMVAR